MSGLRASTLRTSVTRSLGQSICLAESTFFKLPEIWAQLWWSTPVIPVFRTQRQEDHEFEAVEWVPVCWEGRGIEINYEQRMLSGRLESPPYQIKLLPPKGANSPKGQGALTYQDQEHSAALFSICLSFLLTSSLLSSEVLFSFLTDCPFLSVCVPGTMLCFGSQETENFNGYIQDSDTHATPLERRKRKEKS